MLNEYVKKLKLERSITACMWRTIVNDTHTLAKLHIRKHKIHVKSLSGR